MKKIISVFLIPFFVVMTNVPVFAGSAVVLSDEQLDDVHAMGLFGNFEASFGRLADIHQSTPTTPSANSFGGFKITNNANFKVTQTPNITAPTSPQVAAPTTIQISAPTAPNITAPSTPAAPQISAPTAPTTPQISAPATPTIAHLSTPTNNLTANIDVTPTLPTQPSVVTPQAPSVPNIVEAITPSVPTISSFSQTTTADIQTLTPQANVTVPTQPSQVIQPIANVLPVLDNVQATDQIALVTQPSTATDLLSNITPESIVSSSPVAQTSPATIITPSVPTAPTPINIDNGATGITAPAQIATVMAPEMNTNTPVMEMASLTQNTANNLIDANGITAPTPVDAVATTMPAAPVSVDTVTDQANQMLAANTSLQTGGTSPEYQTVDQLTDIANNAANEVFNNANNVINGTDTASNNNPAADSPGITTTMQFDVSSDGNLHGMQIDTVDSRTGSMDTTSYDIANNNGNINILSIADSSQANQSSIVTVNALNSIVPVNVNIVVNIDSSVQNLTNTNTIDIFNLAPLQ